MGHVDAIWTGPSGYTLVDGTYLEHGETVCSVPEGEAIVSDNWHPVPATKPKTGTSSTTGTTE